MKRTYEVIKDTQGYYNENINKPQHTDEWRIAQTMKDANYLGKEVFVIYQNDNLFLISDGINETGKTIDEKAKDFVAKKEKEEQQAEVATTGQVPVLDSTGIAEIAKLMETDPEKAQAILNALGGK